MEPHATTTTGHPAGFSIGRNLRRWRTIREMTLSALAEQAGVAKSTVSLIERGQGNPSIDTVWALAAALRVPFASLFHEDPRAESMSVVREHEISPTGVAPLGSSELAVRHLLTRASCASIEIYSLVLQPNVVYDVPAHAPGVLAHVTVAAGRVEVSAAGFCEILAEGDLISVCADRVHTYRVLTGPVRLLSVHEYAFDAPPA
jgi:transcriptional regulator with XRE-family HTH domain